LGHQQTPEPFDLSLSLPTTVRRDYEKYNLDVRGFSSQRAPNVRNMILAKFQMKNLAFQANFFHEFQP
jgi:hypothetical protein